MANLIIYLHQRGEFGLARADVSLLATLREYGVLEQVAPDRIFARLDEVFTAWEAQAAALVPDSPVSPSARE